MSAYAEKYNATVSIEHTSQESFDIKNEIGDQVVFFEDGCIGFGNHYDEYTIVLSANQAKQLIAWLIVKFIILTD